MAKSGLDERKLMKLWVKKDLDLGTNRYWYRIPDSPYGGHKPSDVSGNVDGHAWLLEFKVNRKKKMTFCIETDVKNHQIMHLIQHAQAGGSSAVVVYDTQFDQFIMWEV